MQYQLTAKDKTDKTIYHHKVIHLETVLENLTRYLEQGYTVTIEPLYI